MYSLTCTPLSSSYHTTLKPNHNPLLGADATLRPCSLPFKKRTCFTTRAILSSTREDVLKHFNERRALKVSNQSKTIFLLSLPSSHFVGLVYFKFSIKSGFFSLHVYSVFGLFVWCCSLRLIFVLKIKILEKGFRPQPWLQPQRFWGFCIMTMIVATFVCNFSYSNKTRNAI